MSENMQFTDVPFRNRTILELLKIRKSVRKFLPAKISDDDLTEILEAGRLSPSGGNQQSWKFIAIRNKAVISQLSDCAYGQEWIKSAPLAIVLCTECVEAEKDGRWIQQKRFPDDAGRIAEMDDLYEKLNQEEHQTKIPGTHMTLCALEKGIYSTMVSYFDINKVAELLNIKTPVMPSEILVMGYPDESLDVRSKRSLSDLVTYLD